MAREPRLICASEALPEGGRGVRFELAAGGGEEKGFAVRHGGAVCAFVNRCPHLGTELDWQPGEFFEESGLYLVCSTHGAIFEPRTGFCVAGPCRGASLEPLQVRETNGRVVLVNDEQAPAPKATPESQ
jgi:nitrite reductase/ring-hydroxylating ferredoxin subunit